MKQELQSKQPTVRRVTTITDVTDEKGTRRTIKVTERVTTYSKTVEVIEYGPGEKVPSVTDAVDAADAAPPVNDKVEKISMIRFSEEEIAKIVTDEFDAAIDAALANDVPATAQAANDPLDTDFEYVLGRAVKLTDTGVSSDEDVRSAILSAGMPKEDAITLKQSVVNDKPSLGTDEFDTLLDSIKIKPAVPHIETVNTPAVAETATCPAPKNALLPQSDPAIMRAVDLIVLDCHCNKGQDHSDKMNSLWSAVGRFYISHGERKDNSEIREIVLRLLDARTAGITDKDISNMLDIYPEYRYALLVNPPVEQQNSKPKRKIK